jgi:hypothetical protein
MTVLSQDYIATHREPIFRDKADFLFFAPLEADQDRREWEQLWGRIVGPHQVEVCCIPFFAYDLNLGDIVQLDQENVVEGVVARSGQVTFRAWLKDIAPDARSGLIAEIDSIGAHREWSSENLLALSIAENSAQGLADLLQNGADRNDLIYENGTQVDDQAVPH